MPRSYNTLRATFTVIHKKSECSLLKEQWDVKKTPSKTQKNPKAGRIQDNLKHYKLSLKEINKSEDAEE